MASKIRTNFHATSEAMINKQINMELYASYVYMAMVSIFLIYVVFAVFKLWKIYVCNIHTVC